MELMLAGEALCTSGFLAQVSCDRRELSEGQVNRVKQQ